MKKRRRTGGGGGGGGRRRSTEEKEQDIGEGRRRKKGKQKKGREGKGREGGRKEGMRRRRRREEEEAKARIAFSLHGQKIFRFFFLKNRRTPRNFSPPPKKKTLYCNDSQNSCETQNRRILWNSSHHGNWSRNSQRLSLQKAKIIAIRLAHLVFVCFFFLPVLLEPSIFSSVSRPPCSPASRHPPPSRTTLGHS